MLGFLEDSEAKQARLEKVLSESLIANDQLDRDIEKFLKDCEVTEEQLTLFLSNKEHFTEDNWNEIQKHKKLLDEMLQRDLNNIANPLRVKKAYKQRKVENHWLFVR